METTKEPQKERFTFTIKDEPITVVQDTEGKIVSRKYKIPHHPDIPKEHWGKIVAHPTIAWWQYPVVKFKRELKILGDPMAQKRHRTVTIPGSADGTTKQGFRQFDPGAASKKDFLSIVQDNAPDSPLLGAVKLDCYFYFPRPKSHYKSGKNSHILKDDAPLYKISKPDRDNLDKFVLDALNTIYWKDDGQVCAGEIIKEYSDVPRTILIVTEL